MKNVRKQLLASAAGVLALGGTAYAADMGLPMKAPPAPPQIPYTNWQGFYIGGLIGAARLNETAKPALVNGALTGMGACPGGVGQIGYNNQGHCSAGVTGFIGGVEVGYDWQSRYFVYGVAADWTWTGLKQSQTGRVSGTTFYTHQAKIDWLASFRGRMGLAVDDTLVYFTGGLALGELKSSVTNFSDDGPGPGFGSLSKVQAGWVAGLGVEHKFNQNWSIKAEALYYDFGKTTASTNFAGFQYSTDFTHEVIVGRVGLAYHW
jgi:outer membrane immunogenic protein